MNKKMISHLMLLLTAVIWGGGFSAQSIGAETLGPLTFTGLRMALASLAMLPVILLNIKLQQKNGTADPETGFGMPFRSLKPISRRALLIGGSMCALVLTLGSTTQQIGISMGASTGKSGFISALYIIIVPVLYFLMGRKVHPVLWLAVALSIAGLYFLCVSDTITLDMAVVMLIADALFYSFHILIIDRVAPKTDGIRLNCVQTGITAILCMCIAIPLEKPAFGQIVRCMLPLLYAGVLSGGAAYALQILGQKHADPTTASLMLSLESVFSALFGWILLGDALTVRELFGCALMFGGILLATLSSGKVSEES